MGKQINYWLKYEEFLQIAQAALDCGCVIIKPDSEERKYGQSLDIITEDKCRYYFYLPKAGSLMAQQIPFRSEQMTGYNAAGNTVIEVGFSFIHDKEKEIVRSRLFVTSGYYDETGEYIARPECLTRTYQKLICSNLMGCLNHFGLDYRGSWKLLMNDWQWADWKQEQGHCNLK